MSLGRRRELGGRRLVVGLFGKSAAKAALCALAFVMLTPACAVAQRFTLSTSHSTTQTFTDQTATVRVDNFSTQIIGRLNGGSVYDQTFSAQFSDPSVQSGVADARAAITNAGGPGVVIGVPSLVSRNVTLQSQTSQTSSIVTSETDVTDAVAFVTFGPAQLTVGDYGVCDRSPNNPSASEVAASGCSTGESLVLGQNDSNANVHTNTAQEILRTTTTTSTYLTAEVYELLGINGAAAVQPIGFVHTAVQSSAFERGERFLQRLGQEAGSTAPSAPEGGIQRVSFTANAPDGSPQGWVWAEGYALDAHSGGGGRPREDRDASGFAAGVTFAGVEGFTFGIGVDRGDGTIRVGSASERADLDLTQIGGFGRYESGPWFASLAGTFGFGDVDATRTLLGSSKTKYDVRMGGGAIEAGYVIDAFAWRVTPTAGLDYLRVHTDGFSESGALGLRAGSHSADRTRGLVGFDLFRNLPLADGQSVDVMARIRGVIVLDGRERTLPVAFTAAPGAGLSVRGSSEGRFGAEVGAGLKLHLAKNLALTAGYDGRFSAHDAAHAGRAGVSISW